MKQQNKILMQSFASVVSELLIENPQLVIGDDVNYLLDIKFKFEVKEGVRKLVLKSIRLRKK